jgi:hypothetical protein
MPERGSWWSSRKFWVSVGLLLLRIFGPRFGIEVPNEALAIGAAYLGAEGLADAAGAFRRNGSSPAA